MLLIGIHVHVLYLLCCRACIQLVNSYITHFDNNINSMLIYFQYKQVNLL